MAIVNRDLDNSEKKELFTTRIGGPAGSGAAGATYVFLPAACTFAVLIVPYTAEVETIRTYTQGATNAPILSFFKSVYVSGAGQTLYALGVSGIPLVNFASIGVQGASILPASGSTQIQVQTGDVIIANNVTGAATEVVIDVVLKKLADIVSTNGQQ